MYIPMILLKSSKVKIKGSKISKTRAREGGASVFSSLLFPKAAASANRAIQQAGKKEWGLGEGIFARPIQKRSPAALLVQSRVPQKSFFLLEKKLRAKSKKCEKNFFAEQRALASGGGAGRQNSQSGFSSKKVRISSNKHHQIELAASLGASPLASAGSFASKSKGFLKSISSRSAARRRFTNESCIARRAMSRFFSFAVGERQSEILLNCRCAFPFSITIKK
jgi:hypothetical protein